MFYQKKYLKYKYKYFKLLGGSGKGTYDIEKNICIPTVVNSEVQQKIYTINFLWLNRNVDISHKYQKYIFPFNNKKVKRDFCIILFYKLQRIHFLTANNQ